MAEQGKSWLRRRVERALVKGLTRAYSTVRVDPDKFLLQLRAAYRVPISGYHGVFSLEIGEVDAVADSIIRSGMKVAAVEGAGLGLGGLITIVPDLGHPVRHHDAHRFRNLACSTDFSSTPTMRSRNCGLPRPARQESISAASCWRKKSSTSLCRGSFSGSQRRASAEVVEKWAGRVIPLASSAIGAGLNYWFVRAWGERAQAHFRERHLVCDSGRGRKRWRRRTI